jgi:Ca2+-binding RTX toxin-like protein
VGSNDGPSQDYLELLTRDGAMAASSTDSYFWATANVTYSFEPGVGAVVLSATRDAFNAYSQISGVNFIEVGWDGGTSSQIDVLTQATYEAWNWALSPTTFGEATTFPRGLLVDHVQMTTVESGSEARMAFTAWHEAGHAAFGYWDAQAGLSLDQTLYPSILTGDLSASLRASDIMGAQAKYGADAGNNLIYAGVGSGSASGGAGNDTIYGQDGADILYGNTGLDAVYGNTGEDIIYLGQNEGAPSGTPLAMRDGVEKAFGGQGDDLLYGNHGSDILYGNFENDTMFGGQDNDTLYGGRDNDWLNGNLGNDVYYGGQGADTMVASQGDDQIIGFNAAEGDRVDFADPAAVSISDVGGNAFLAHASGSVTLIGIGAGSVDTGWFI